MIPQTPRSKRGRASAASDGDERRVAHLAEAGNRVTLGDKGGQIVNIVTGRTIALERRGRIYVMKMFIPEAAAQQPFRRQGA